MAKAAHPAFKPVFAALGASGKIAVPAAQWQAKAMAANPDAPPRELIELTFI